MTIISATASLICICATQNAAIPDKIKYVRVSQHAVSSMPPAVIFNEDALRVNSGQLPSQEANLVLPGTGPLFDDTRAILKHVMNASPAQAVVYPTERYYYYNFLLGPRLVSGNIRFADAEDHKISIGYFDIFNSREVYSAEYHDGKDGVSIKYDQTAHVVVLQVDSITRSFILDQEALEPPTYPLLDGEVFISGIRDESGYFFHLFYWPQDRSFYYVLNPLKNLPEKWIRGNSKKIEVWFGENSQFCFVRHKLTGRYILVGVHRRQIEQNTWYDGPFDQVPPRLPIGKILEEAYPYVISAGGIDEHGNFLQREGQRVAISPYETYTSGNDLESRIEQIILDNPTPASWTQATYEYKKYWLPPKESGEQPMVHNSLSSTGWPANHWGKSSRVWGSGHDLSISRKWTPNHDVSYSQSKTPPVETKTNKPEKSDH